MSDLPVFDDAVRPFLIQGANVRGKLVRLGPVVDAILRRHAYPDVVLRELGELVVITATLGANLKSDGIVTAQVKGNGPVRFMVADATSEGELRAYADGDLEAVRAEAAAAPQLDQAANDERLFRRFFGEGYLMVTLDHGDYTDRYQGIVGLTGASLTDSLLHYFTQSQQVEVAIETAVGLVERPGQAPVWHAACLMLERLPPGEDQPRESYDEDWNRVRTLLATVNAGELLDPVLEAQNLLFNLFHEDGVWIYDPAYFSADCRCSRERIMEILKGFADEDLASMKEDDGQIHVTCQFCNSTEHFTDAQLKALRR